MSKNLKIIYLIGILLSAIFLYLFLKEINFTKLQSFNIIPKFLILAVIFHIIGILIRARKFCISVEHYNNTKFEIKSIFIGSFFNLILPFRLGELIRAIYLGNIRDESRIFYFTAIIFERVFDLIFLFLFISTFAFLTYFINQYYIFSLDTLLILFGVLFSSLLLSYLFYTNNKILFSIIEKFFSLFNQIIKNRLQTIIWIINLSLKEIVKLKIFKYLLYSFLQWTFGFFTIYFLCKAMNINLKIIDLCFLILTIYLSLMIPSGPGFLGSYQLPVLNYFKNTGFNLEVAYQFSVISWILLVIFFSVVGFILFFKTKKYIFRFKELSWTYNKWIPRSIKSNDYGKILVKYFNQKKSALNFNNKIISEKFSLIKDLGGGSEAYTFLINVNSQQIVRKWADQHSKSKLKYQHDFIANQKSKYLPSVINSRDEKLSFFYDMKYYSDYLSGFNFAHTSPLSNSKKLIFNIVDYILSFKKLSLKAENNKIGKNYLENKLYKNMDYIVNNNPLIKNFISYENFYLNDKKYLNLNPLKSKMLEIENDIYSDLENLLTENCHGDPTFDNLIVKDENNFKFLDPNYSDLSSYYIDIAKVRQSLNGGYEFLINLDSYEIKDNRINITLNKSSTYETLNNYFLDLIKTKIDISDNLLSLHEAIHFARLLRYRNEINPKFTIIFFVIVLKYLNEYLLKKK